MTRKLTDEQIDDMLIAVQEEGIKIAVGRVYVARSTLDGEVIGVYASREAADEDIEDLLARDNSGDDIDLDDLFDIEEHELG